MFARMPGTLREARARKIGRSTIHTEPVTDVELLPVGPGLVVEVAGPALVIPNHEISTHHRRRNRCCCN